MENELPEILYRIISDILSGKLDNKTVKSQVRDELDTRKIYEHNCLIITDCYYALKHIDEEHISSKEPEYFKECLSGKRKYDMQKKFKYILE